MKKNGFTLIEIMIALVVFAILASITASSMYYAFETRKRVTRQADALGMIELALSFIQQDTRQAITRSSLGNELHIFSPFIGQTSYIEFTRDGFINPTDAEHRSSLLRIAYLCKKHQLIRRFWDQVDTPNRQHYHDKVLLDNLETCAFGFLTQDRQMIHQWQEDNRKEKASQFPLAVQMTFKWASLGEMSLLFMFPEAVYAANHQR